MAEPTSRPTRILVVDDERMNREVLVANLKSAGYETVTAEDGQQAWGILSQYPNSFDVVLLDRRMPRMDGMELLGRLKADESLAAIPVIMQTALATPEDVVEGIAAGVYYYLAKPLDRRLLLSVTAAAIEDHQRLRRLQDDLARRTTALALMDSGTFRFRTLDEANTLAVALARSCPRSSHLVVGLSEIFTNAVEHGNLGICYDEKARLLAEKRWTNEIEARLDAPEHRAKRVAVTVERQPGEVRITVRDEGAGFDWRAYVDLDPARAFSAHGRGIAMARRLAFDALEYRDPGNEVVCVVRDHAGDRPAAAASIAGAPCAPMPPPAAAPSAEMALARTMQAELLPPAGELTWLERRYGFRLSAHFETSSTLGGDIWGVEPLDDSRFALWLADFSGHGISAALNTFRLHTLMEHVRLERLAPAELLSEINLRLVGLLPVGQYATMLYGIVDSQAGRFTYAGAATPHPVLVQADGRVVLGDGSGLPLGISRTVDYVERSLDLNPGALLFLASDALSEGLRAHAELFNGQSIADLVVRARRERGDDVDVGAILAPFLAGMARPLPDDLTALCCLRPPARNG